MALVPQQAARIAIGFARRGAWQAFWAANEVEAYANAVVIPLPVRFTTNALLSGITTTVPGVGMQPPPE